MDKLEELIRIQQEYEYFMKQSRQASHEEAYALLKKNPVFQSSYMKQVFALCDKRRSMERITQIKIKLSQKIFWGVLLFLMLAALTLTLV